MLCLYWICYVYGKFSRTFILFTGHSCLTRENILTGTARKLKLWCFHIFLRKGQLLRNISLNLSTISGLDKYWTLIKKLPVLEQTFHCFPATPPMRAVSAFFVFTWKRRRLWRSSERQLLLRSTCSQTLEARLVSFVGCRSWVALKWSTGLQDASWREIVVNKVARLLLFILKPYKISCCQHWGSGLLWNGSHEMECIY